MSAPVSASRGRRILASAAATVFAGAALTSVSMAPAQAKTADWINGPTTMTACFGAPGKATGSVTKVSATAGTFKIAVTNNTRDLEFRARYGYWDATQNKMLFTKFRVNPAGTSYSGSVTGKQQLVIYRRDVLDPATAQLAYTSAGAVGCD
jgi:hypothetical protein